MSIRHTKAPYLRPDGPLWRETRDEVFIEDVQDMFYEPDERLLLTELLQAGDLVAVAVDGESGLTSEIPRECWKGALAQEAFATGTVSIRYATDQIVGWVYIKRAGLEAYFAQGCPAPLPSLICVPDAAKAAEPTRALQVEGGDAEQPSEGGRSDPAWWPAKGESIGVWQARAEPVAIGRLKDRNQKRTKGALARELTAMYRESRHACADETILRSRRRLSARYRGD